MLTSELLLVLQLLRTLPVLRHPSNLALTPDSWSHTSIPLPSETHDVTISVVRGRDFRVAWSGGWVADVDGGAGVVGNFKVGGDEDPW